jgi:hypothetical protein
MPKLDDRRHEAAYLEVSRPAGATCATEFMLNIATAAPWSGIFSLLPNVAKTLPNVAIPMPIRCQKLPRRLPFGAHPLPFGCQDVARALPFVAKSCQAKQPAPEVK